MHVYSYAPRSGTLSLTRSIVLDAKKKKTCIWSPTNKLVQNSVDYAKFRVLKHLHRMVEELLVKVARERSVCVCVCVYYLR